jgi:hypothetical protein
MQELHELTIAEASQETTSPAKSISESPEVMEVHIDWHTPFIIYLSIGGLPEDCHTPFQEIGNEASIRVPRMFQSHAWQQYDKQMQCY